MTQEQREANSIFYKNQVEYLKQNKGEIYGNWVSAIGVFKFITTPPEYNLYSKENKCGCIVLIKGCPEEYKAYINGKENEELTNAIVNDNRLPTSWVDISEDNLDVFREWQERIDVMQTNEMTRRDFIKRGFLK